MSQTGFFVVLMLIVLGVAIWCFLGWREATNSEKRVLTDHQKVVTEAVRIEHALPFNDARDGHFRLWPRNQLDALASEHCALRRKRTNDILSGHTRKEGTT